MKRRTMEDLRRGVDRLKPGSVECPKCGRPPGMWCVNYYVLRGRRLNRVAPHYHRERYRAAGVEGA